MERIEKKIREKESLRKGYSRLTEECFGVSFEEWYGKGYWGPSHRPYCMVAEGEVAANVSLNTILFEAQGRRLKAVQLGGVCTREAYRGRGYAGRLMEEALRDAVAEGAGLVYLYANDSVTEFYPKFGFREEREHAFSLRLPVGLRGLRKLSPENPEDLRLLRDYYGRGNPLSALQMVENFGLLMFYCAGCYRDCLYYAPELDAVLVLGEEEGALTLFDLFSPEPVTWERLARCLSREGRERELALGFTPLDPSGFSSSPIIEQDYHFFVLGEGRFLPAGERFRFPLLSHT